ncbi:MAG: PIG-L family deacetylase [Christensenellales bacterium]
MKKIIIGLLLMLLLLTLRASAQEAQDISAGAAFAGAGRQSDLKRLTDRKLNTLWQGPRNAGTLEVTSVAPCYGLYISWAEPPRAFRIERETAGGWVSAGHYEAAQIVHQYYPLQGLESFRLVPDGDDGKHFGIQELYLLGDGDVPSWVQRWEPTVENADLMVLFAHPDDEVLFFGGTIPYYAGQRGLKVLPVALSTGSPRRVSELLDCLWSLGLKTYPLLGPFEDRYSFSLEDAYAKAGRRKVNTFITEIYRRFKPKVVVSHDINGEYGHGMHRLCADIAQKGIALAADPAKYPESAALYGTHQVQKLYLHLYSKSDQDISLEMDWDLPLPRFGGRTAFDVALQGYGFHLSQHRYEQYQVEPRSSRLSSYRFGLWYSSVGQDGQKNDFMENIDLSNP